MSQSRLPELSVYAVSQQTEGHESMPSCGCRAAMDPRDFVQISVFDTLGHTIFPRHGYRLRKKFMPKALNLIPLRNPACEIFGATTLQKSTANRSPRRSLTASKTSSSPSTYPQSATGRDYGPPVPPHSAPSPAARVASLLPQDLRSGSGLHAFFFCASKQH